MRRIAFALLVLLTLSACYRPLYGDKAFGASESATEGKLNNVGIASIPDQNGQHLRNLLIDRFYTQGRPAKPAQELRISFRALEFDIGTQKNATNTRTRVEMYADCNLYDIATQKRLWGANLRSIVSYDILDEQYATLTAKENTYDRGIRDLAEQITTRLLLFYDNNVGSVPAPVPVTPPPAPTKSNLLAPPANANGRL